MSLHHVSKMQCLVVKAISKVIKFAHIVASHINSGKLFFVISRCMGKGLAFCEMPYAKVITIILQCFLTYKQSTKPYPFLQIHFHNDHRWYFLSFNQEATI
jgi:hypothetical protein